MHYDRTTRDGERERDEVLCECTQGRKNKRNGVNIATGKRTLLTKH